MKKLALITSVLLLLTACGSHLTGEYGSDLVSYKFNSDGTVDQVSMGIIARMKYKLNGQNIELETPNGTLIYVIQDDGSITTPFGVLKKKS
jgi:outer membrane lipopolysaccharide assembly protein LptE/RlpB